MASDEDTELMGGNRLKRITRTELKCIVNRFLRQKKVTFDRSVLPPQVKSRQLSGQLQPIKCRIP